MGTINKSPDSNNRMNTAYKGAVFSEILFHALLPSKIASVNFLNDLLPIRYALIRRIPRTYSTMTELKPSSDTLASGSISDIFLNTDIITGISKTRGIREISASVAFTVIR